MTIIQPNKSSFKISLTMIFLSSIMIGLVIFNTYLYNKIVDFKFALKEQVKNIKKIEVINAELKNELYRIIDVNNLTKILKDQPLVIERQPEYFKISLSLDDHLVRH